MTDEERVISFKIKLDKIMRSYFWIEVLVNFVEIAIGAVVIFLITKNTDNERALMLSLLVLFVCVFLTSFVLVRIFFGSFAGMNKISSFRTRAEFIIRNLADCQEKHKKGKISDKDLTIAETIYNEEIANLVLEIDKIVPKK